MARFYKALSKDNRMGSSHMNVPGPDGRYGFGGPCFPKDVSALIEFSKEIGYELSLLKKANIVNNSIEHSIMILQVEKKNKILNIIATKRRI